MDKSEFERRAERLKAVDEVIAELDENVRGQAFALLSGYVTGEVESSGGGKQERPQPRGRPDSAGEKVTPDRVTIGTFLKGRKLPSNKDKATAIVVWSEQHGEKSELSVADVGELWRKSPYKPPKNLNRDLGDAEKQGLLHAEGRGSNKTYTSVGPGRQLVEDALSEE